MRSRRGLLISAPFVVSVLALAINDHVLKTAWPGFVTGKLSDVAGVVMMALLVTALTGRSTIGFWATAIGFAALKTVSAVAMMVTPVLGGRTRTDPTDLIALIVLIPVWFWARDRSISPRDHDSAWLLPLQIVAISAAVFATTATSCEEQGVIRLAAVDGVAYATTVTDVYESNDGGVTWAKSNVPERDERLERSSLDGRASCIGTDLCVEIVVRADPLRIDEIRLGDRNPILTATAEQRQQLFDVVHPSCGDDFFGSVIAVQGVDGEHVLVSMGEAGVLHRGPDRAWEWVAVGDDGLQPDEVAQEPFGFGARSTIPNNLWEGWPADLARVFLVLAPLAVLLSIIPIYRLAKRHQRDPVLAILICIAVALALAFVGFVVWALTGPSGSAGALAVASAFLSTIAIVTVVPLLAWHGRPRRPADWLPPDGSRRAG